ncbi:MAG: arylesterase [Candidatus Omnitrophica bacterium]|nr:arylesterase [Candidatus Omnitrophota bacterium]
MNAHIIPPAQEGRCAKNSFLKLSNSLGSLVFAFLLFLHSGCTQQEPRNLASGADEIICFGNSITAGSTVTKEENYPFILSQLLGYPVINAGRSGDTSFEGLMRLEKDVLIYQPRLVIIEFAGNDFLRKMPLSQTIDNIKAITELVQAKGAMAAIVDVSSGMIMSNYRKELKALARKEKAIFIPNLLKGIITNPTLKNDNIHPNAEGHRLIAEKIYKVIKPYLQPAK